MVKFIKRIGTGKGMRYKVVLHQSKEGYDVSCPGLPGCWSQGSTEAEAIDNIRSAIIEYLDLLRPIYRKTSAYGHFGRDEPEFTWEKINMVDVLKKKAGI